MAETTPPSANGNVSLKQLGIRACAVCAKAKAKCIPLPDDSSKCQRCNRLDKECSLQPPVITRKRKRVLGSTHVTQLEEKLDNLVTLLTSSHRPTPGTERPQLAAPPPRVVSSIEHHPAPLSSHRIGPEHELHRASISSSASIPSSPHVSRSTGSYIKVSRTTSPSRNMAIAAISPPLQDRRVEGPILPIRRFDAPQSATMVTSATDAGSISRQVLMTPSSLSYSARTQQMGDNPKALGVDEKYPGHDEAEELLHEFRTHMSGQFPFVVVAANKTSHALRREKPFLWTSIMTTASHRNMHQQLAMGKELIEEFSTRLLLRAEKNIDLLQGLLVFLAWYHYHIIVNPQLTNLLYLAKALVVNLGLNRIPASTDRRRLLLDGIDAAKPNGSSANPHTHVLEEWRALAGCYYLTSIISASCRNMESIEYTSYIGECCQKLADIEEYQSDVCLMHLVRLQHVAQSIRRGYAESDAFPKSKVPVHMYVKALQADLKDFKSAVPLDLQQNTTLSANFYAAEINLYEIGLYDVPNQDLGKSSRLSILYSCLLSTKAFCDIQFSIHPMRASSRSFISWTQFGAALLVAFRLSTLDTADGWDLSQVRVVLDFFDVLDRGIEQLEEAVRTRQSHELAKGEMDIFTRFVHKLRQIKGWYRAKLASDSVSEDAKYQSDGGTIPLNDFLTADLLGELDESFWQGVYE